jgi:hypothetical protein
VRWEFRYMTEGKRHPPRAEAAELEVRAAWAAATARAKLPCFAGGKSFGGRMTSRAHAAAALPGLRGLVLAGFPLHPPGKPAIARAEHLAGAAGPILFVQGTRDELADLALLRPVVAALGTRATLHVIEGADHGFTRAGQVDAVAAAFAEWISHHL